MTPGIRDIKPLLGRLILHHGTTTAKCVAEDHGVKADRVPSIRTIGNYFELPGGAYSVLVLDLDAHDLFDREGLSHNVDSVAGSHVEPRQVVQVDDDYVSVEQRLVLPLPCSIDLIGLATAGQRVGRARSQRPRCHLPIYHRVLDGRQHLHDHLGRTDRAVCHCHSSPTTRTRVRRAETRSSPSTRTQHHPTATKNPKQIKSSSAWNCPETMQQMAMPLSSHRTQP